MMNHLSILTCLSFFALNLSISAAEGDITKGKQIYQLCIACHGANAEGSYFTKAPPLAGQQDWYIIDQLKKFKDGLRGTHPKDIPGIQMRLMSKALVDDNAIKNVAAYLGSLEVTKQKETLGGDSTKGQILYKTCKLCHGSNAEGNPVLRSPSLKQLPDWYIFAQLKKFKNGIRETHSKGSLESTFMSLSNEKAMIDVATYITYLQ